MAARPFRRTIRRIQSEYGFTLVEIMIVLAIIVAILAVGAPRLFDSSTTMRTAIRKMAVMTRDIRSVARLTNSTMRIALLMSEEKGYTYWVESAPGTISLLSKDQAEELKRLTESQRDDEAPKNEFSEDARVLKQKVRLPRGLVIDSVEYGAREEEITAGMAYVHFFPQGLSEDVAIHLSDKKKLNWTITINPLTGKADVYERKVTLKELRNP